MDLESSTFKGITSNGNMPRRWRGQMGSPRLVPAGEWAEQGGNGSGLGSSSAIIRIRIVACLRSCAWCVVTRSWFWDLPIFKLTSVKLENIELDSSFLLVNRNRKKTTRMCGIYVSARFQASQDDRFALLAHDLQRVNAARGKVTCLDSSLDKSNF